MIISRNLYCITCFLIMLMLLNNSNFLPFKGIGLISMLFSFIIFLLVFIKQGVFFNSEKKILGIVLICFFYFFVIFIFSVKNIEAITRFFQLFFLFFLVLFFARYAQLEKNKYEAIRLVFKYYLISSYFLSIWYLFSRIVGFNPYFNENFIGGWVLYSLIVGMFLFNSKFYKFFNFLFIMYILNDTGARTSIVSAFIAILILIFWNRFLSKGLFYFIYYVLNIFLSIFVILFMTSRLSFFDIDALNLAMRDFSGKNLLSGRQDVWEEIIKMLPNHLIFGHGLGAKVQDYTNLPLSAHNLYLQVLFQTGILGLLIIFLVMTFIFIFIFKNKKHFLAKYLSSVFFIVLFTQNFEVTFSQNNIALSLLFWILLGLGLGYFIRDKYEFTDSSSSK